MRIGRGHRDYRDITLKAHVRALLRRSHNNYLYGNPYISLNNEIRLQDAVLRQASIDERLHRSTAGFGNYREVDMHNTVNVANTMQ